MKDRLAGLIRLHKWRLDEVRRKLVGLETMRADFVARQENLEAEILTEQAVASESEVGPGSYGAYAQSVIQRRDSIGQSIREIDAAIADAREEVAEAFQEVKKYEIAAERARERAAAERNRRDRIAEDEMGLAIHRRKKRG